MMIALLTLPAAIASRIGRNFLQIMVIAAVLCMLFISSGLAISYSKRDALGADHHPHRIRGLLRRSSRPEAAWPGGVSSGTGFCLPGCSFG